MRRLGVVVILGVMMVAAPVEGGRLAVAGEPAVVDVLETVERARAVVCARVVDRSHERHRAALPLLASRRERILWCMNALAVGAGLDWTMRGRTLP